MNNGYNLKPFTCYFCNKSISGETEQGHRSTCGALLEPCPYKCGAYTQRKMKTRHLNECPNKPNTLPSKSTKEIPNKSNEYRRSRHSVDGDNNLQSYLQQEEIGLLKSKMVKLEQLCKNISHNFAFFKEHNENTFHDNQTIQIQHKLELEKLQYQHQTLLEWKKLVEAQIENLKKSSVSLDGVKNEILNSAQSLMANTQINDNLQALFYQLKFSVDQEQQKNLENNQKFVGNISELRDLFLQENATTSALWNDQKTYLESLEAKSNQFQLILDEQQSKLASLTFDIRTCMNIATETAERFEIQEKVLNDMQTNLRQIKFDLEVLEEAKSLNSATKPGVFLWKISNFNHKLQCSKNDDTVLKSPIFYTDHYGYKIRLIVYLNGIKKWKGRHLIMGIHVLNGEYDALLQWPCNIEAKISLRDLENVNTPKNYSKFINAKRNEGGEENEDPQESSNEYIFIPHTILTKTSYLKDDAVFIEVKVNNTPKKQQEETTL